MMSSGSSNLRIRTNIKPITNWVDSKNFNFEHKNMKKSYFESFMSTENNSDWFGGFLNEQFNVVISNFSFFLFFFWGAGNVDSQV